MLCPIGSAARTAIPDGAMSNHQRSALKEASRPDIRRRPARLQRQVGKARKVVRLLTGKPLKSSESSKEQINSVEGLSALSLDALTSVAYGPQALLVILAEAGTGALHFLMPVTIVIVVLLAVLVVSYRQVIEAFPGGGGAYAVSKSQLGRNASLVAAASLIVDYTLTVAVSISAGVASLISAYPALGPYTVQLCLVILGIITLMNLRGLGETARAFLLPTLIFIIGLVTVVFIGVAHPLAISNTTLYQAPVASPQEAIGVLLILKAFSAGCSALTGVEAIASGTPQFREPRARTAKKTELLLGILLGSLLLGLAFLAQRWNIAPSSHTTVLSQIIAIAIGHGWPYYALSITITTVLALAANTSFGGLPVLTSILAKDNFLPHRFSLRGERQVHNSGILALAVAAAALLIGVDGSTNELIPLFAIGVFVGFTLSQTGLVVYWRRLRKQGWRRRIMVNGLGALATAISTAVFIFAKFAEGAWLVLVAVPGLILLFLRIETYYLRAGKVLAIDSIPAPPEPRQTTVIIPIAQISKLTQFAIEEALSLGQEVIAVYVMNVAPDENANDEDLATKWQQWNPGVRLEIIRSEYASVVEPIVSFIDELRRTIQGQIVVLIPVAIPDRFRYRILHNQLDLPLTTALSKRTDLIVAKARFRVASHSRKGQKRRRGR